MSLPSPSFCPLAPEQRLPRDGSDLHHQQPGRVARCGQQTRRDLHERQQHGPGQAMPLVTLQEEHPEANEGGCLLLCVFSQIFTAKEYE